MLDYTKKRFLLSKVISCLARSLIDTSWGRSLYHLLGHFTLQRSCWRPLCGSGLCPHRALWSVRARGQTGLLSALRSFSWTDGPRRVKGPLSYCTCGTSSFSLCPFHFVPLSPSLFHSLKITQLPVCTLIHTFTFTSAHVFLATNQKKRKRKHFEQARLGLFAVFAFYP